MPVFKKRGAHLTRRPLLAIVALSVSLAWLFHSFWLSQASSSLPSAPEVVRNWIQRNPPQHWDALEPAVTVTVYEPEPTAPVLLNGGPTSSFRDNLRPELKYISAWPTFGWNNQVMQYMNLIYLALITERIPILSPFSPKTSHHVKSGEYIAFGKVFDIPRMHREIGIRVLDWGEVKDPASGTLDSLGCWNLEVGVWKAAWRSPRPRNLNLDISYTPAPEWVKLVPGDFKDQQATFWSLASLGFADTRPANEDLEPEVAPISSTIHFPDEHLLCFDNMYFVCAHKAWEFDKQYSPAWRFVGRYMRFTAEVQVIADGYTRKALGVEPDQAIPPYITVHVRRGDFKGWCNKKDGPVEDCLAPLSAYARRVEEVRAEIFETKGIRIEPHAVFMTSDETDAEWWDAVQRGLGWTRADHADMLTRYGPWYPTFIDGVIQSGGLGFVGTHKSTVSILAERRVLEWQKGVTRTVFWGKKGADDH